MSPFVIAAANAQVPVTIRSGRVAWVAGFRFDTPSIFIVCDPRPEIFAPIAIKNSPRSTTSGSLAAFSIVVIPFASVAAVIIFSVAPTLGNSKTTKAPVNACLALAIINPCSNFISAPISANPLT